jgi:hypothetical protein
MNRPTGLQATQVGVVAMLERWREVLPPRDFAVLLDLLFRWLELECEHNEHAQRRWAA